MVKESSRRRRFKSVFVRRAVAYRALCHHGHAVHIGCPFLLHPMPVHRYVLIWNFVLHFDYYDVIKTDVDWWSWASAVDGNRWISVLYSRLYVEAVVASARLYVQLARSIARCICANKHL